MDFSRKKQKHNPYSSANLLSKVFFLWLLPLFREGYNKDLSIDDLYDTLPENASELLGNKLEKDWTEQLKKREGKSAKLVLALWHFIGWKYLLVAACFTIPELFFRVLQPVLLKKLLESFSDPSHTKTNQYLLAGWLSLATFGVTISFRPLCYHTSVISMRCRIACSSLIYRKALRLCKSATGETDIGQVTNLLSNDVNRFDNTLQFLPYIWIAFVQLAVFTTLLWKEFGVACFPGLIIILLTVPIQYWNGKCSREFRRGISGKTDQRGKLVSEVTNAIRVIKLFCWEKPFCAAIQTLRKLEVKLIKNKLYLRGIYATLYLSTPKLVVFVTLLMYVLQSGKPTAYQVYFLTSVYFFIIQSMLFRIPGAISALGEIVVSLSRLEGFLLLKEIPTCQIESSKLFKYENSQEVGKSPSMVSVRSLSAKWPDSKMSLDDINLKLEGNKLVMIIGAVGSGKTSLLKAIMQELPEVSGKCWVRGQIAYASQEPWLFSGSVKQNILFGKVFNQFKYNKVVEVSALKKDCAQLEFGYLPIVGERGLSLSGGEKARVCLSRCLYQDADIYLLDDPLSALDVKVGRFVFEKSIAGYLAGKLRIMVTHQLQYLPKADHIILMENGRIAVQGTYNELVKAGTDFLHTKVDASKKEVETREKIIVNSAPETVEVVTHSKLDTKKKEQLEGKGEGYLGLRVLWDYLKSSGSPVYLVAMLALFLVCQGVLNGSDYWLNYLTKKTVASSEAGDDELTVNIGIFGGLVGVMFLLNLTRAFSFFTYCMKISVELHNQMLRSLVRTSINFFNHNPSGRIMNRFTKDLGCLDEQLPSNLLDMIQICSNAVGAIVLIIISNWVALFPTLIALLVLWIIQRIYVTTSTDIRRLECIAKSPLLTHTAATLQGISTIRAARAEKLLISQFDSLQDVHSAASFLVFSIQQCFVGWTEGVCVIFLTVVIFCFLFFCEEVSGADLGMTITQAIHITTLLQLGMRQSAEVENLMTCVERTYEYANLKPEAALDSPPAKTPSPQWPNEGRIQFSQVFLAYEGRDVLRNLCFEIRVGEKIGIVGRTGAGKSSIVQALFRLTEHRGNIYVDGINTREIGLGDLRKAIGIIPQDPLLFSGSMRFNLDPCGEFSDPDLWKVIEEVNLKRVVTSLDITLSDNGVNLSSGERQLVCLARLILRKNKIVVMDEATACVDLQTERLIRDKIRAHFRDSTIITIAHRLKNVIDMDRVLVLDDGMVKEYDRPDVLLSNPTGIFTSMVLHSENVLTPELLPK